MVLLLKMSCLNPFLITNCVIKKITKNPMQSGYTKSNHWELKFIDNTEKTKLPLIFKTQILAKDYANRNNFLYQVIE